MTLYDILKYNEVVKNGELWAVTSLEPRGYIVVDCKIKPSEVCKELKSMGLLPSYDLNRKIKMSDIDSDIVEIAQRIDNKPILRLTRRLH